MKKFFPHHLLTSVFFLLSGSVSSNTKMVLVNVLHFKSGWLSTFDETLVNKEFEVNGDSLVKVPMMIGDFDSVGYRKLSTGAHIFGLPFKDPNYQMILVLPPENTSKVSIQKTI